MRGARAGLRRWVLVAALGSGLASFGSARAQCVVHVTCGDARMSSSASFPSEPVCRREVLRAQGIMRSQGGGCTYGPCVCSGATGRGAPAMNPGQQLLLNASQALGEAIGRALFGPSPQERAAEAARAAEEARVLEQQVRDARAAAQQRRRRFEEEKGKLLGALKGDEPTSAPTADDYHRRETERRAVLDRTSQLWCKLNAPLYPTRPIVELAEDRYAQMLAYYQARKAEWDRRCAEEAAAAASRPLDEWKDLSAPTPEARTPPPAKPCAQCWLRYGERTRGCRSLGGFADRQLCVNSALDGWTLCVGGCRGDAGERPAAILSPPSPPSAPAVASPPSSSGAGAATATGTTPPSPPTESAPSSALPAPTPPTTTLAVNAPAPSAPPSRSAETTRPSPDRPSAAPSPSRADLARRCAELRARALAERKAMRVQQGAAEHVSEGSLARSWAMLERAGLVTVRLGKLLSEANEHTALFAKAAELAAAPASGASAAGIMLGLGVSGADLRTLSGAWAGLQAEAGLRRCKEDAGRLLLGHAALVERASALAGCASVVEQLGQFARKHRGLIKRLGKTLGVTSSALELWEESRRLQQEIADLRSYAEAAPKAVLDAVRRLDAQQKAILGELAQCEARLQAARP